MDLNRILKEYTRGQLTMLADASRRLYDSSKGDEPGAVEDGVPNSAVSKWVETVDTRKMTLSEYKRFISLQQGWGEQD